MGSFYLIFLIVICFFIASYEWHKMVKHKMYRILGYIFLILSFYSFYELSIEKFIIIPLFICISTDMGGYVLGVDYVPLDIELGSGKRTDVAGLNDDQSGTRTAEANVENLITIYTHIYTHIYASIDSTLFLSFLYMCVWYTHNE